MPEAGQLKRRPRRRMLFVMICAVVVGDGSSSTASSGSMMTISLSPDARTHALASIKRYLAEELELDVGDLKAGLLLDFFLREIGPSVYNGAIADAQTYLRDRVADLDGACALPEFAYWPTTTVRRSAR